MKIVRFISLTLALVLLLGGCVLGGEYEAGKIYYIFDISPILLKCTSERSCFDTDGVTLDLHIGLYNSLHGFEASFPSGAAIGPAGDDRYETWVELEYSFALYAAEAGYESKTLPSVVESHENIGEGYHLLRLITENEVREGDFGFSYEKGIFKSGRIDYKHSESIKLSDSLFKSDAGTVYILALGFFKNENTGELNAAYNSTIIELQYEKQADGRIKIIFN